MKWAVHTCPAFALIDVAVVAVSAHFQGSSMRKRTSGGHMAAMLRRVASLALLSLCQAALGAPPANDDFANAIALSGAHGLTTGSSVQATAEAGESVYFNGGKTVWYRWVAPVSGQATFHTLGSDYDTTLSVHTGNAVNALTVQASNNDSWGTSHSRIRFATTAGTEYRIAIDGSNGGAGSFRLTWSMSGMVAAGGQHSCAMAKRGSVLCWGSNDGGQSGLGDVGISVAPAAIAQLAGQVTSLTSRCVLTSAGGVKCWGFNQFGQVGDGSTTQRNFPADVLGLGSDVASLSTYYGGHACAVTTAGAVLCWGNNNAGQLGDGSSTQRLAPVPVNGLSSGITAVTTGGSHSCALNSAGGVVCWGWNGSGELGDGTTNQRLTPVAVSGLASGVVAIAAGGRHTCALLSGGAVKCWGFNLNGALGDGTTTSKPFPVAVSGLTSGVAAISAGVEYACALSVTGTAKCWGRNDYGQLGDGSIARRLSPVAVSGLSGTIEIAPAQNHTCALLDSGAVQCWGNGGYGELGNNSTATYQQLTPLTVVGEGGVGSLNVNLTSQTIGFGELQARTLLNTPLSLNATASSGLPVTYSSTTPAVCSVSGSTVTLLSVGLCSISASQAGNNITQAASVITRSFRVHAPLALGGGYYGGHTCALDRIGSARCWGSNSSGQLGDGSTSERLTPVSVIGLPSALVSVSAGMNHTCGLSEAGGVMCWGKNAAGSLGDNSTTARAMPVQVVGLPSGAKAIATGFAHSCALTNAGTVQCWGSNWGGQLGDNTTTNRTVPVDVSGLSSVVIAITAGYYHTCALTDASAVQCWGYNSVGQLGDNSTSNRLAPVAVSGLPSGVVAIEAGDDHTCALTDTGALYCWGSNSSGQLGDGSTANRLTPVLVSGMSSGVRDVGAGSSHTCALTSAGAVKCWGWNYHGQLGDGSTTNRSTPTAVSGLSSGVIAMSAGGDHSCALSSSGTLQCWGSNVYGRLGDNSTTDRLVPVNVRGSGGVGTLNLTQQGSAISLQAFPESIAYGDTVALVATVTGNSPSGTVQFRDGGVELGSPVPLDNGIAALVTSPLGVGSRSLTALYLGDALNAPSVSAAVPLTVGKAPTSTSLSVSPASPLPGSAVTLTASVSGTYPPTGQVAFLDGSSSLGTAALNGGTASLQTNALSEGTHTLSARYLGDANNAGSDSVALSVTVAASGPGGGSEGGDGDVPIPAWALALLWGSLWAGLARRSRCPGA